MKEIPLLPNNSVPLEVEIENDYNLVHKDTSGNIKYGKKVSYRIPAWFISHLNEIAMNLNEIIRSPISRSIMGLDKATQDEPKAK